MATHEDPFSTLPAMAESEHSADRMRKLVETAEALRDSMPDYVGMTAFGSTVRGEAHGESDVDINVFFDPTMETPEAGSTVDQVVRQGEDTDLPGMHIFDPSVNWSYKFLVGMAAGEHGIPDADVSVLPISEAIVDDQTAYALRGAERWDTTGQGHAVAPRNIRGLFNAPVDTSSLRAYRERVLRTYADSPHGETAWRMLRHLVATFEVGRGGDHANVTHRELPQTLDAAIAYYLEPDVEQ